LSIDFALDKGRAEVDVANRTLQDKARQARNDLYRQHILEAAEQVFAEHGFDSSKLQDISKLAGVSMGTIYAIFPGKEDLFRAILSERGRELLQVARDGAHSHTDPRVALDGLIAAYIDYFIAHPNFLRMHVRLGTSWVLGPTLRSQGQVELWAEIHTLQAELMRRGVTSGAFIDEEPAFLAKIFSALDQVVLADWVADGMTASRGALIERMQKLIGRVIAR
jgi:AcrR family transcriptional regulator